MTYTLTKLKQSKASGGGSGTAIICDLCTDKIKTGEYRLTRGDA